MNLPLNKNPSTGPASKTDGAPPDVRNSRWLCPLLVITSLILLAIGAAAYPYAWDSYARRENERRLLEAGENRHQFYRELISRIPPAPENAGMLIDYEGFSSSGSFQDDQLTHQHFNLTFDHVIHRKPPSQAGSNEASSSEERYWISMKVTYDPVSKTWHHQPPSLRNVYKPHGATSLEDITFEPLKTYYIGFIEHYDAAFDLAIRTVPLEPPTVLLTRGPRGWQYAWQRFKYRKLRGMP